MVVRYLRSKRYGSCGMVASSDRHVGGGAEPQVTALPALGLLCQACIIEIKVLSENIVKKL